MKIVFLDQEESIPSSSYLDPLRKWGEVVLYDNIPEDRDEVVRRAAEAEVIFFATTNFDADLFDRLPRLKVLQFLGTGVWNLVDMEAAKKRGISVLNIEGYGNNAVAEYTLALALSLARKLPQAQKRMEGEEWSLEGLVGMEIEGSCFAVLGTGNIGSVVASKASLLGARVLAHDLVEREWLCQEYGVEYVGLEELVSRADFLTLHLKTTPETHQIIDALLLERMKPTAYLINVARAQLVDNEALYKALLEERLGGAALDVFENEPPIDYRFSKLKNCITTPHMGFFTHRAVEKMMAGSIDKVVNKLKEIYGEKEKGDVDAS